MRFLFFHADKEHTFNNNHETYPKLFFYPQLELIFRSGNNLFTIPCLSLIFQHFVVHCEKTFRTC